MPKFAGLATVNNPGYLSALDKKKLNQVHYDIVTDGGADPTGGIDATAIIQAANDQFVSTGGIVYFPPGTYLVSGTINGTKEITWRGANSQTSVIKTSSATLDVFNITQSGTRFESLRVQGLAAGTRTAGYAINIASGANNCVLDYVDIIDMWSGVHVTGQSTHLLNMNIRNTGANASNGQLVLIDAFTDNYITALTSDNASNPTGFGGIRVTNLSSLVLTDCNIIHSGNALDLIPSGSNTTPSVLCTNCFFDNSTIGCNIASASGTVSRCLFTNCWFSSCATAGVVLNNATAVNISFDNCQFFGNPFGIQAVAATDWAVRNSAFAGNSTAAVRTTAAAAHTFAVEGCDFSAVGGFGNNALNIDVLAGTYKRYSVVGNRGLDTGTTSGWSDLGAVGASDQKNTSPNLGGLLGGGEGATISAAVTSVNTTEFLLLAYRIPANSVKIGDTFRIKMFGLSNGAGTLIFKIKAGANGTIADNQACINVATAAQVANQRASIDGMLVVRSIGAGGTVVAEFVGMANAINISPTVAASATAAVVTTAAWFIDLTVTVSASTFTALTAYIGPA